jgi:hypothetical protein
MRLRGVVGPSTFTVTARTLRAGDASTAPALEATRKIEHASAFHPIRRFNRSS